MSSSTDEPPIDDWVTKRAAVKRAWSQANKEHENELRRQRRAAARESRASMPKKKGWNEMNREECAAHSTLYQSLKAEKAKLKRCKEEVDRLTVQSTLGKGLSEKELCRNRIHVHPFQALLQGLGFNITFKRIGVPSIDGTARVVAFKTNDPKRDLTHILDNIHRVRELAPDVCRDYRDDEDLRLWLKTAYSRFEHCHKTDLLYFPRVTHTVTYNDSPELTGETFEPTP